jgi:hypothetical protein
LVGRRSRHLLRLRLLRKRSGAKRETNDDYHAMNEFEAW